MQIDLAPFAADAVSSESRQSMNRHSISLLEAARWSDSRS
jgi:hypothetical protein